MIIAIAAMTAYFWEMHVHGICASDLLYAADDGYFDTDADDFYVRSCADRGGGDTCAFVADF